MTDREPHHTVQRHYCKALGPDCYGNVGPDADTDIREQENCDIRYIGYQTLLPKICNGGRTAYILTNFIPNISALNSKHFTN